MLGAFGLNEAMVRWLNDLAPQGIFTTDTDFVIRGWNRWLETNSGLPSGSVVGLPIFEAFPELTERGLDALYRQAALGHVQVLSQRFHRFLLRMPAPLGLSYSEMQQSARIAPLYRDGKITGIVTVIDDVTERVVREAELKTARDAAEQANRAKDEFLAMLAHELRTPINSIVGWTQVLRKREPDAEMLERALKSIEQNSLLQVRLVEDLIDISRIVAGKIQIERTEVDLHTTLQSVFDAMRQAAEKKGLTFETMCDNGIPIIGDSRRLQQVVLNLLNNAVKFTAPGGLIRTEVEKDDDCAEIRVVDTGIGIKPEFLPHVFERYRQGDSPRDTTQGLGLGLDVVKRIVELHHGSVSARSEGEGKGAVFTVRLPLKSAASNVSCK